MTLTMTFVFVLFRKVTQTIREKFRICFVSDLVQNNVY